MACALVCRSTRERHWSTRCVNGFISPGQRKAALLDTAARTSISSRRLSKRWRSKGKPMVPFAYLAAPNLRSAISRATRSSRAEFIAGGTDMLQLLQERVRAPEELIDLNGLPLSDIEITADGIRIGALARMAQVVSDSRVREQFPAVTQALLASASPQIRNMASIGGNLLQR